MLTVDRMSHDHSEFDLIIRDFVSEIYIIQRSGIVKYAKCFENFNHFDPQLVGSFVTALESFVEITSRKTNDSDVKLLDIGTSSSRWFLNKGKEILIVMMVPNNSKFMKSNDYSIIYDITSDILTSFVLLHDNCSQLNLVVNQEFETDVNEIILEKIQNFILANGS